MTDDDLITGAAAPAAERIIHSRAALDAVWVACVATLLIVSAFLPLVDLEEVYLRTADAPLRVYTLVLPVVALIITIFGVVRHAAVLAAVATGVLVPSVGLAGSVASSLFFDAASPFTDAGVPVTLAAAAIGLVMLLRWFIYHPTPLPGADPRPPVVLARATAVLGLALVVSMLVSAVRDDDPWSLPFALSTALMLLTALVVIAAGFVRSLEANALAAAACIAQFTAVIVVLAVEGDDGVALSESATTMRTGVVGMVLLVLAGAVAVVGALQPRIDAAVEDTSTTTTDDVAWRWTADE